MVDLVVLLLPAVIVVASIRSTAVGLPIFFVLLIAGAAQDVLLTARRGQSIGKALLRIRVVNERDGSPPDLWHAFLRWWVASLVPPLIVWVTWDDRRQGIHDKAAETIVVRA